MRVLIYNLFASALAVVLLAMSPATDGRLAVVVPNGTLAATVVFAAGGRLLSTSGAGTVAVAISDDPMFWLRLYSSGASLVVNPLVARGCFEREGAVS